MAGMVGLSLIDLMACTGTKTLAYQTEVSNNSLSIPLTLFAQQNLQLVRPKGWFYDIAVSKKDSGYEAILLQCTHMDNQLQVSADGYTCSLHGSRFDTNGQVRKGPAERPLKKFQTKSEGENLIITV